MTAFMGEKCHLSVSSDLVFFNCNGHDEVLQARRMANHCPQKVLHKRGDVPPLLDQADLHNAVSNSGCCECMKAGGWHPSRLALRAYSGHWGMWISPKAYTQAAQSCEL